MIYDKSGTPLRDVFKELMLLKWERLRMQQQGRPANYVRNLIDGTAKYRVEMDRTGAPRCVLREMHEMVRPGANSWLRRAA